MPKHRLLVSLGLFAFASTAAAADDIAYLQPAIYGAFAGEVARDYTAGSGQVTISDVLMTFHDAKGEVIGKCAADKGTVTEGKKGAADFMEFECDLSGDTGGEFALLVFCQGDGTIMVEGFWVLPVEDSDGKVDIEALEGTAGLYLENATATVLEDLWDWSTYADYDLNDVVFRGDDDLNDFVKTDSSLLFSEDNWPGLGD